MTAAGFPHSGIAGSTLTCSSPTLFAAYRALLRLSVPRHPPCALLSLDRICSLDLHRSRRTGPPTAYTRWCSRVDYCSTSLSQSHYPDFQSTTLVQECFSGRSTCESFRLHGPRAAAYSRLQKGGDPAAGSPT